MHILLFGSGSPASVAALEAVAASAQIDGVVVPQGTSGSSGAAEPLIRAARGRHIPVYSLDGKNQHWLLDELRRRGVTPDLICVATFPLLLGREVLDFPRLGGINVHHSLLPKHRGPDPLFWTYVNDDLVTGVTVHWINERPDAGDIVLQREIPLARGRLLFDLYFELAGVGAELLAKAVSSIATGDAQRVPQDEGSATAKPSREKLTWRIDAGAWPSERVWHVVRGLTSGRGSLLRDEKEGLLEHGTATRYAVGTHDREPGTIIRLESGFRVFCVDGYVDVEPAPHQRRWSWLRRMLRPLRRFGLH